MDEIHCTDTEKLTRVLSGGSSLNNEKRKYQKGCRISRPVPDPVPVQYTPEPIPYYKEEIYELTPLDEMKIELKYIGCSEESLSSLSGIHNKRPVFQSKMNNNL